MKKKNLLLTILCAATLLLGGRVMGQSIVTIGTSTSTNTYTPIQTTQTYSYSQQIYKATEISGTGTIKSIAFYATANGCTRSLDIYLINTTKETFSSSSDWINVSDSDKVFSGSVTFSNNSWTTVTVSDFTYTGNNLALVVHDKTNNTESSAISFRVNGTYSNTVLYKVGNDASSPVTAPTTGYKTGNRNNIQLSIAYDYPEPTELTISDITNESASIAWTDCTATTGNTFSRYEYQLKTTGVYGSLTTTSNPCELSGLEAGTMYTIRVRAVYTDGASNEHTSKWVETSFTTDCNDLDVSLASWDFEGTSTLPDCWRIKESSNDYPKINTSSSYSHGGNNSLQFSNTGNQIVLLPAIDGGLNGKTLNFYAKKSSTIGTYTITVGYYNSLGEFTTIKNNFSISDTHQSFEVEFDGLPNYVKKVAIKGYTDASYRNLYIDDVSIVEPVSCAPVSSPTVGTVTYNSAQLSWTAGGSETNWKLQYKDEDDNDWTTIGVNSNPYTLTGLTENTTYSWQVAAWCDTSDDDNISTYVAGEDFSTPVQFPMPTSLAANNISTNSADITWTAGSTETAWQLYYTTVDYATPENAAPGDLINVSTTPAHSMTGLTGNTTYYVYVRADYGEDHYSSWTDAMSFRTTVLLPYSYDFTDASELNSWTLYNCFTSTGISGSGSNYYFHFAQASGYNPQYLITPLFENNSNALLVSFDYKLSSGSLSNILNVGYSTTDKEIGSFTWPSSASVEVNSTSYQKLEYVFQVEGIKYIAVKFDRNGNYLNTDIDNISFTPFDKVFNKITDNGLWTESSNWSPAGEPDDTQSAFINGAATIPIGCAATANNLTIGTSGSLTIEDGGRLIVYNTGVQATVKKEISGVGNENWNASSGADGWYFIASPVNNADFSTATEQDEYYDLYMLDWTNEKWLNQKNDDNSALFANGFQRGTGYLYASKENKTLSVAGEIQPLSSSDDATVTLATTGWNLIGNPLTCKVTVDKAFSELNNASSVTNQDAGAAINPFQGIAVYGTAGDVVTFTKAASQNAVAPSNNALQMTLSQTVASRGTISSEVVDNAIVKFNGNSSLPKFSMLEGKAKLYIPQNGEDYAIVSSEAQGEMPVNFKANENGQYTLTVNAENVEMNYLHLIDNMTGADIDLMANPSYTFNANASDYASRFRIVFSGNGVEENLNESDNFAFIGSDGQLVVTGTGTIQILDMMGRVISTKSTEENISTNGMASGVYVLRLIGNETKTQKIVVR